MASPSASAGSSSDAASTAAPPNAMSISVQPLASSSSLSNASVTARRGSSAGSNGSSSEEDMDQWNLVQVSREIMHCIQHQCECDPISMGEYLASPQQAGLQKSPLLPQWHSASCEYAQLLAQEKRQYDATDHLAKQPASSAMAKASLASTRHEAHHPHATASVVGSMFTLTNTILGSGTLAVPFAIASSGWLLGNLVMIAIACITRYSVFLLLQACEWAGKNCAKTYESIGHYTMGNFGSHLAEFTFIFGGFGTLVSYFIFITDLFSAVLQVSPQHRWMVTVVFASTVVCPLSLHRHIGKLRLASVLAILSITYVVFFVFLSFCVVYHSLAVTPSSPSTGAMTALPQLEAIRLDSGSVYTVTLLISAFACHNTALPVFDELRRRTIPRMNRAVVGAITTAFLLYETIGLFGYLQFGATTRDNILLNFSHEFVAQFPSLRVFLAIGQTCMAFALLLTAPIAMWPFRSCLLSVYLRCKNGGVQTPSNQATTKEYTLMTIGSQTLILLCSILVPSVKIPLSIVGSVSGSLLIFIMPSMFYLRLAYRQTKHCRCAYVKYIVGPLLMFVTGLCVGVVGLSLTLYKLYREYLV